MRGETADRVMECIASELQAARIEPSMHLRGQLGVDSLDLCNLVLRLEENFGLTIEDADEWQTVSDIIASVERRADHARKTEEREVTSDH